MHSEDSSRRFKALLGDQPRWKECKDRFENSQKRDKTKRIAVNSHKQQPGNQREKWLLFLNRGLESTMNGRGINTDTLLK